MLLHGGTALGLLSGGSIYDSGTAECRVGHLFERSLFIVSNGFLSLVMELGPVNAEFGFFVSSMEMCFAHQSTSAVKRVSFVFLLEKV